MNEETSNPVSPEAGQHPVAPPPSNGLPPTPPADLPSAVVVVTQEPPPEAVAPQPPAAVAEQPPAPEAKPEPEPLDAAALDVESKAEPEAEPAAEEPEPAAETAVEAEAPPAAEEPKEDNKKWYVVKVQSGREESIKDAIERRVKIEGLEEFYGQILIPVEKVTEVRNNKRYVKTRKLYPGYIMANVEYNDRILYLFRETSGVGDFVGGSINKPPQPMKPHEVEKMMGPTTGAKEVAVKPKFDRGDRVRVRDGTFATMEGEVKELVEAKNLVKVELSIFGRPVPVELEYWQVEPV